MMCPDMTVEKNVLAALGQVKKYKQLGKENMALCASSNRPVIVLQKKEASAKLADLNGKWMISEAGGETIVGNGKAAVHRVQYCRKNSAWYCRM